MLTQMTRNGGRAWGSMHLYVAVYVWGKKERDITSRQSGRSDKVLPVSHEEINLTVDLATVELVGFFSKNKTSLWCFLQRPLGNITHSEITPGHFCLWRRHTAYIMQRHTGSVFNSSVMINTFNSTQLESGLLLDIILHLIASYFWCKYEFVLKPMIALWPGAEQKSVTSSPLCWTAVMRNLVYKPNFIFGNFKW